MARAWPSHNRFLCMLLLWWAKMQAWSSRVLITINIFFLAQWCRKKNKKANDKLIAWQTCKRRSSECPGLSEQAGRKGSSPFPEAPDRALADGDTRSAVRSCQFGQVRIGSCVPRQEAWWSFASVFWAGQLLCDIVLPKFLICMGQSQWTSNTLLKPGLSSKKAYSSLSSTSHAASISFQIFLWTSSFCTFHEAFQLILLLSNLTTVLCS